MINGNLEDNLIFFGMSSDNKTYTDVKLNVGISCTDSSAGIIIQMMMAM